MSDLAVGTVARRSLWLSVGSVVGSALAVLTSFVLARWLGPTRFGRTQGVLLVCFYAALVRSGAFESGLRRSIRLTALGRHDEARRARDLGSAVDVGVSLAASLAVAVWAVVAEGGFTRQGLLLAPLIVVASTAAAHAGAMRSAEHRFDLVAASGVVRSVSYAVAVLGGVALIGDAALFVAPALADLLALVVLVDVGPRLVVRPPRDRALGRDLVRSGWALGALPAAYWVYRVVGPTSVAIGTDVVAFGLFSFAAAPVAVLLRAISQVESVLTPAVWSAMARDDGSRSWLAAADRVTVTLFVVSGFAANLAQAGFAPVVAWVLPEYRGAVPTFEILALNVVLLSVAVVPSLVLRDETAGRPGRYLGIWIGALGLNAAANAVVLALGGGVRAVAWNDVWVQAAVVVLLFALAGRVLGVDGWARRALVGVPLLAVVLAVMAVLRLAEQAALGLRVALVVAAWGAVAVALRTRLVGEGS